MVTLDSVVCIIKLFGLQLGRAAVISEPGKEDLYPPARVTDLRADPNGTKVVLTFTAPGDDLDRGYGRSPDFAQRSCGVVTVFFVTFRKM